MKFYKIIVWLFVCQSMCTILAQGEEDFVRGNTFFTTGHYVQACDAYKKIENKGFAVLYNMGLAYLNIGNRAQAIVYGKRAEKQANFKQLTQLYELFDCMHRQIDADYAPTFYEQLAIFLKKCILSISMLLIQLLLLISIIALILCWYRRWYLVHTKVFLWMIFCGGIIFSCWWHKTNIMQRQIGIVIKKVSAVFAGPDASFYKKSELHESDEVIIVSKQQGYYQVKLQQTVGWIDGNDIELV